ncbi:MAG: fibronectin type III domain-containing protein [Treponema sp.]|nr:fibronectin type III domain-containing protein [Treponema sp.]
MRKTPGLPLLFLVTALLTSCYNPFFDSILGRRRGRNREDAGDGAQPLATLGVVTDLAAVRDSPVTFTWIDPEGDFDYIEIWYGYSADDKTGTSLTPIRVPKGTQTCTIPDPLPGAELYFHFITVDKAGKRSAVVNYLVPFKVPVQVTNLTGKVTGGDSVTLTWTNPANTAFDHIEIEINPGGTIRKVKKGEGEQSYTWAGLSSGTEYTFTVKTFDKDGNITTAEVTVTLVADTTPPGPVTNLAVVDGGFGSVELNWKNPPDADLQYVEITANPPPGRRGR